MVPEGRARRRCGAGPARRAAPDAAVHAGTASRVSGGGSVLPTSPAASLPPVVPVPPLGWWAESRRPRCLRLASAKATLTCKLLCRTHLIPVAPHAASPHHLRELGLSRHRWGKWGFAFKETPGLALCRACRTPPPRGPTPCAARGAVPAPVDSRAPSYDEEKLINFLPLPNTGTARE